jgi:hypothetical protein
MCSALARVAYWSRSAARAQNIGSAPKGVSKMVGFLARLRNRKTGKRPAEARKPKIDHIQNAFEAVGRGQMFS